MSVPRSRLGFGLPLVGALAFASVGRAGDAESHEEPKPFGIRLGVRTGYSFPRGNAFDGSGELNETIAAAVPVRVDVGVRVARHVYVGSLVQIGVLVPKGCPATMTCVGTDLRVGAMIAYHVFPSGMLDPWVGVGAGYEILNVTRSIPGSELHFAARGLDLDAELGVRLRVTERLRVGPVVSVTAARYTSIALNGTTMNDFTTALHAWTMLGVGGSYDL